MRQDIVELVVGIILISVASALLGRYLANSWEQFASGSLGLILLVFFYVFVYRRLSSHQRTMSMDFSSFKTSMSEELNKRLPPIEYITRREGIELELIAAVLDAEKFIIATGSRSRYTSYLQAIENKVKKNVRYIRVLTGPDTTKELLDHLSRLIMDPAVTVRRIEQEPVPNILATEKVLIITLPDPAPKELGSCLRMRNPDIANNAYYYVSSLSAQSITSYNQLTSIPIRRPRTSPNVPKGLANNKSINNRLSTAN